MHATVELTGGGRFREPDRMGKIFKSRQPKILKKIMKVYFPLPGAHQMEPPSPIQALGVNPFPSRFIIRTVPRGDFTRRRWEEPITTTK